MAQTINTLNTDDTAADDNAQLTQEITRSLGGIMCKCDPFLNGHTTMPIGPAGSCPFCGTVGPFYAQQLEHARLNGKGDHGHQDIAALLKPGGCILDMPSIPPAIWGDGEEILWAEGQSFLIGGHDGTGKTTVAGNLVKGRLGLGTGKVLGMPVKPGARNVLVLMMDRPSQAKASLARMFSEADRDVLDKRLVIWEGPPPEDMAKNTGMLARLCTLADADTCIVDSLKDAAIPLTDDATGAGWNRARQQAIVQGTELVELHHPRKPDQASVSKPPELADFYGSRWIAAGAGSAVILHGNPGDPIVRLYHRKPVITPVGPWDVLMDGPSGEISINHGIDLLGQIRQRKGTTAAVAAALLFGDGHQDYKPSRNDIEKARGRLRTLEKKGLAVSQDGAQGMTWYAASCQDVLQNRRSERQDAPKRQNAKTFRITAGHSAKTETAESWHESKTAGQRAKITCQGSQDRDAKDSPPTLVGGESWQESIKRGKK